MELVQTKTGIRFREKVYIGGKSITKTFLRKTDALHWKRNKLAERDKNEASGLPTIQDISFEDFSKHWIQNKADLAPRSLDAYRSALKIHLIPLVGTLPLRAIRISHGHQLIRKLRERNMSPARINSLIIVFKQILSDAIRWEYLYHHPLMNLKTVKMSPQAEKYWMPLDIAKFLNANKDNDHYALFVTALNTGMRRSELLGLMWDKVDFVKRQIEVSRSRDRYTIKECTKTRKIVYIPMNDVVFRVLTNLREERRSLECVFLHKDGRQIDMEHLSGRIFKDAIKAADVPKIRFHNLRSTFASNFMMKGGNIYTLARILGHSSIEMTAKKYAHLDPNFLKKEIENIAFEADSPFLAREHLRLV